jgi:hypothetical protein
MRFSDTEDFSEQKLDWIETMIEEFGDGPRRLDSLRG